MDKMVRLWEAMAESLKELGAASVQKGEPFGLRGYPDYHRILHPGSFRRSAWEEPLTAGIALELNQRCFRATTERFYPLGGRCDLVVDFDPLESVWIECKTAFRQHLGKEPAGSSYDYDYSGGNCFDPGEGRDSWVAGVSDIGAKDVPKLLSLVPAEARYVGVLLLGFDRQSSPLTTRELYDVLPPYLTEWTPAHGIKEGVCWPDSYPPRAKLGFRERVWFWYRPVTEPAPAQSIRSDASTSSTSPDDQKRNAALAAVMRFCSVPSRQHGGQEKSGPRRGWYKHDWAFLVQEVNTIYHGKELADPVAWKIGNRVRFRFSNVPNWDYAVNSPGAHEQILKIILDGIRNPYG